MSLPSVRALAENADDVTCSTARELRGRAARTVWGAGATIALCGCILGLGYLRLDQPVEAALHQLVAGVPVVGAVLAVKRPRNPIGWIFLVSGAFQILGGAITADRLAVLGTGSPSPWAIVIESAAWPLGFPLMVVSLFWFPDGRLMNRRWVPVVTVAFSAITTLTLFGALSPFDRGQYPGMRNPVGIAAAESLQPLVLGMMICIGPLALLAATSIVLRYRRGDSQTRIRIRWVLWIVVIQLIAVIAEDLIKVVGDAPEWLLGTTPAPIVLGLPIVVGIAVVRHRLFDIDVLLNRTLVYLLLSGLVVVTYAIAVTAADQTTGSSGRLPTLAVATVVAFAFHPLRVRLQRVIDRRLFGQRDDPLAVLASLSRSASTSPAPLDDLVQAIAVSLRLHHVAIDVQTGDPVAFERIATFGSARGAPVEHLPMSDGQRVRGRLVVARRSPNERLRGDELDLLSAVAANAAWLVRSERLTSELQRARERIVQVAEDERRRLRRDLHDGLGSRLTGIGYRVEAVRLATAASSGAQVTPLVADGLDQTKLDLADAVSELRRIIDDLRPGTLDDLGLVRALTGEARRALDAAGLACELEVELTTEECASLSAAAEVVLFRISVEAVTNVVRHARAHRCRITLTIDDAEVVMVVEDDGAGMNGANRSSGDHPPAGGVGIRSMCQRAEEVGGRVSIGPGHNGGTCVMVRLPLSRS